MPESLKNVLLVMASGGILVRPEDRGEGAEGGSGKAELWDQTWRRLERLLPDLKGELFPAVTAEELAAAEVEANPVTEADERAEAEEAVLPQEVVDGAQQAQPADVADVD